MRFSWIERRSKELEKEPFNSLLMRFKRRAEEEARSQREAFNSLLMRFIDQEIQALEKLIAETFNSLLMRFAELKARPPCAQLW